MMERQLKELFMSVKTAAEAAENSPAEEDRCLDALKQLKEFPVNLQILLSTQVGRHLRPLTRHKNSSIKSLASDVVSIWKTLVVEEKLQKTKNGHLDADESAELKSLTRVVQDKVENSPKLSHCNDPLRDKVREALASVLCKVASEAEDNNMKAKLLKTDPHHVAVSVETVLFHKWGKSNGAHSAKYRSLLFNIRDPKNPDFRRKVLLGDIEPGAVVELTPGEMASDARQVQNEEIKQKALFNSERVSAQQASTDQFTCGKCRKKETTYYQMQTRSADEPMTTFVTCVNCNNRWKFC